MNREFGDHEVNLAISSSKTHIEFDKCVNIPTPILRDGNFEGQKGKDDEVVAFQRQRAEQGDAEAQMWLGKQVSRHVEVNI